MNARQDYNDNNYEISVDKNSYVNLRNITVTGPSARYSQGYFSRSPGKKSISYFDWMSKKDQIKFKKDQEACKEEEEMKQFLKDLDNDDGKVKMKCPLGHEKM